MATDRRVYNLATIRELLLAAFTPEDLNRFCMDRPLFAPIVNRFGPGHGFDDMVDEVLAYCQAHLLFHELLIEIKKVNPKQFTCFEPRLQGPEGGSDNDAGTPARFAECEHDLEVLGEELGTSHPYYDDYLELRGDLRDNWCRASQDDNEEIRKRRRLILQALNRLALSTVRQGFGEDGFSPAPSLTAKVVANLAFVGVVGLVIAIVARQTLAEWLPCHCPWTIFFGLPVLFLSILHVVWRLCCSRPRTVDGKVEVNLKGVKRELDIVPWIDAVHFWTLPAWVSHAGALVATMGILLLFWIVPGPSESTPMVERYSVRYVANGATVDLSPIEAAKTGIEIQAGDSMLVTAAVEGDVHVHCTWYSVEGGRLSPEQGCAAWYSARQSGSHDVIGIVIESECKTREWWATVPVVIR